MGEAKPAGGRVPVAREAAARRFRLASPATALAAGGSLLALVVAGLPLGAMAHQLDLSDQSGDVVFLAGAAVGAVVAWHQPRNPVGWILLAAMGFFRPGHRVSCCSGWPSCSFLTAGCPRRAGAGCCGST